MSDSPIDQDGSPIGPQWARLSAMDISLGHGTQAGGSLFGPLTRSIGEPSTSGFISENAAHWAIEPFIPIQPAALTRYLITRNELSPDHEAALLRVVEQAEIILQQSSAAHHRNFGNAYAELDPDSDCKQPALDDTVCQPEQESASDQQADDEERAAEKDEADQRMRSNVAEVMQLCDDVIGRAGYRCLTREEIEECVGVASQWGVPLQVDFDIFAELVVYARGDIIGTRFRRRLRKLYRREWVDVPIYQRMVVLFQVRDDQSGGEELTASAVHLRMFKNIPKLDIDMLLPGAKVRISKIDRVKIIVPSLGGFLMSIRKIAQYAILFAALALHWSAILVVLIAGYLVKSVMSYFQTKNRYQLNLNRNLYFQKLDSNAGVGYQLIQQAHRQSVAEVTLAYYAIVTHDEPISERRLRRRCERLVREAIQVEIEFRCEEALQTLAKIGAIQQSGDRWQATSR